MSILLVGVAKFIDFFPCSFNGVCLNISVSGIVDLSLCIFLALVFVLEKVCS